MRIISAFLLLCVSATAEPAPVEPAAVPEQQACESVDSCIAELMAAAVSRRQVQEPVRQRLAGFGSDAVDALVPLLMHEDLYVRESAGLALTKFRAIDPRHLPALAHAWRQGDIINRAGRGNGWLPVPIAATGSDEGLRLLWADFQRDPRAHSNAQVLFALARFGERLRPLVDAEMAECATHWNERCMGVVEPLHELDGRWPRPVPPVIPPWGVQGLVDWTRAEAPEARSVAANALARLLHPAGREPLQRELAVLAAGSGDDDSQWRAQGLIGQVARYGAAAVASGPAIAHFLDPRFDEDLRADAALALGRIEDRTAVPALMALEPELADDWVLAYNVAESLGRLRAVEARPLLERLQGHWHRGVRNNAARALNAVAGGDFARPDVPDDGRPFPVEGDAEGHEYLYFGHLCYAGDDASSWCAASADDRILTLDQDPVGNLRWPRGGARRIELDSPTGTVAREIRRRIPVSQVQGSLVAVLPVRSGRLVAFNGGEFGGRVYYLPDRGSARALTDEPVDAAWLMDGRLYVAAGLAHLVLDSGHLYVIDPNGLNVERIMRLPASPRRVAVSSRRAVIIETRAGDLAVRADGTVADPDGFSECGD